VSVKTDKASYETRFLIAADGIHSLAARSVRPPFRKDEMALAAVCNSRADDIVIDQRLQNIIAIDFGLAPLGYGWLFPHRGYFSIGVAGLASEFSEPRETLTKYGRSLEVKLEAVRGHFIPLGGIKRRIASRRILLAGDAAGFADPFHGEGIVHAVLSGKLAAGALIDSLKNSRDPADAASRYTGQCEKLIRKQLRVSFYLAQLLDRFPSLFTRIFFDNCSVLSRYVDISSGRIEYRQFLRWLVVRIPFYLAWSFFKGLRRTLTEDREEKFPATFES
jgi:flavin-dependent dehydrogenase